MADLNYMNPGSLDPGVGFKPDGFLGGMEWQKRNKMFEDAVSLQQLSSMRAGEKQGMELDEFKRFAPTREAKNLEDLMTARAKAETIGPRMSQEVSNLVSTGALTDAQAQEAQYKNQFTARTQPSAISLKLRQDLVAQGKAGLDMLDQNIQGLHKAMTILQATGGGPQSAAVVGQTLQQIGIPQDQIRQMIGNPQVMMKNLKDLTKVLMDADPRHQGEMAKVDAQGRNQIAVANIGADATRYAANARATSSVKTMEHRLDMAKTPEERESAAEMILANPDIDLPLKRKAEAALFAARRQLRNKFNRGQVDVNPGGITARPYDDSRSTGPWANEKVIRWEDLK